MKRLLSVVIIILSFALAACSTRNDKKDWGNLTVTLQPQNVTDKGMTADVRITNKTDKTQVLQFNKNVKYTVVVAQKGKEIFKQDYGPQEKSELLNILPNAYQSQVVGWSYQDQTGKKVPAGSYDFRIDIHAATTNQQGSVAAGPITVTVK